MMPCTTPTLFGGKPRDLIGTNDSFTKILLHFDYTPSATSILDEAITSAPNAHPWTCHGNAQQWTGQKKFGRAACNFPGTNADWLDTPSRADYELGASDWTIDFWCRVNLLGPQFAVFGKCGSAITNGYYLYINTSGTVQFAWLPSDGPIISFQTAIIVTDTNWHHYAIERTGTVISLYFDGVLAANGSISAGASIVANSSNLALGRLGDFVAIPLNGQIDEFRVSVGIARFKGPFNIALLNAPYEVPATTGNDSATVCLLHGDGANGGTVFTDSCIGGSGPKAFNNAGSGATTGSATVKFGSTSLLFGQHAYDRIVTGNNADFDFGSGNFTIDFWYYKYTDYGSQQVICKRTNETQIAPFIIGEAGGALSMWMSSNGTSWDLLSGGALGSVASNVWTHVALVRNGQWVRPYINGVGQTIPVALAVGASLWVNNDLLTIGGSNYGATGTVGAYMDEVRISRAARWTNSDFTPPTKPYS